MPAPKTQPPGMGSGKAGGDEPWVTPKEEEDDEEDRVYWQCFDCPADPKCPKHVLKHASLFSFDDEQTCRSYVKRHLRGSAKHSLPEDEAQRLSDEANITQCIETREQRDRDREWQKHQKEAQAAAAERQASGQTANCKRRQNAEAQEAPACRARLDGGETQPHKHMQHMQEQMNSLQQQMHTIGQAVGAPGGTPTRRAIGARGRGAALVGARPSLAPAGRFRQPRTPPQGGGPRRHSFGRHLGVGPQLALPPVPTCALPAVLTPVAEELTLVNEVTQSTAQLIEDELSRILASTGSICFSMGQCIAAINTEGRRISDSRAAIHERLARERLCDPRFG